VRDLIALASDVLQQADEIPRFARNDGIGDHRPIPVVPNALRDLIALASDVSDQADEIPRFVRNDGIRAIA